MSKSLSRQILEKCNYKPDIVHDYEMNELQIYPDLKQPDNFVTLLDKLIPFMGVGNDGIEFYQDSVYVGGCLCVQTDDNDNYPDFRDKLLKVLLHSLTYPQDAGMEDLRQVLATTKWRI